jgi:hypothetical protein
MDIVAACEQVGIFRGAAALCGTTHKIVRRIVTAHEAGEVSDRRRPGARRTPTTSRA